MSNIPQLLAQFDKETERMINNCKSDKMVGILMFNRGVARNTLSYRLEQEASAVAQNPPAPNAATLTLDTVWLLVVAFSLGVCVAYWAARL